MQLASLLKDLLPANDLADIPVLGLTLDSRTLKPGEVFFACQGTKTNGQEYIAAAIQKKAAAILTNGPEAIGWQNQTPIITIPDLDKKLSSLAARFYDFPTKKLKLLGVTGTNGKTSCTHFFAEILSALAEKCGIIGTLGWGFPHALQMTGLTTPNPIQLQYYFNQLLKQQSQAVALEVSSHSIQQKRIQDLQFEIGLFTNLTQDHLDYHGTMQHYAAVKKSFIFDSSVKIAIVNADDEYGKSWLQELSEIKPVYAYTANSKVIDNTNIPYVYATDTEFTVNGIQTCIHTPWGTESVTIPLLGEFNLSNVLAIVTALCAYGMAFAAVIQQLKSLKPVPGRMQTLGGGNFPTVVIDYAHTPDALEKALKSLRSQTKGKLICVFGCGGERDRGKRPLMAKVAEKFADNVIVTSDNPRSESEDSIAADIFSGFIAPEKVTLELDREQAILKSLKAGRSSDCILIAGKGAESYQQIGEQKYPFDDAKKVLAYLHS